MKKGLLAAFVLMFLALPGCGLRREIELKARIARLMAQLQHTDWRVRFSAGERLGETGESSWESIELIAGEPPG